jgi:mannose/fructose/N-acetylgalactosamine-specific phosphotransferase system component IIC
MNNLEKAVKHTHDQTMFTFFALCVTTGFLMVLGLLLKNSIIEYFALGLFITGFLSIRYINNFFVTKSFNKFSSEAQSN